MKITISLPDKTLTQADVFNVCHMVLSDHSLSPLCSADSNYGIIRDRKNRSVGHWELTNSD